MGALVSLACGTPLGPAPRPGWGPAEVALQRRCDEGALPACSELGRTLVRSGRGEKDLERGLVLLETACGQDDLAACNALGIAYLDRVRGANASARTRELFVRACDGRVASACTELGQLDGRGRLGFAERQLYRKACELGDTRGCMLLGLAESNGPDGDPGRADEAFTRACQLGDVDSCKRLILARLKNGGSPGEAVIQLDALCDRGHAGSCLAAAAMFAPVTARNPDCRAALPPAEKACHGNQPDGCAITAACRLSSPEDRAGALEELGRGCSDHRALACLYWADAHGPEWTAGQRRRAYHHACVGLTQIDGVETIGCGRLAALELPAAAESPTEAAESIQSLERACEQPSGQACCDLAEAYRTGTGVKVDAPRAAKLRDEACALGEKRCCGPHPGSK